MFFRAHAFSVVFAAVLVTGMGSVAAQEGGLAAPNPGVVVEIYVHEGGVEIVCPATQCNAVCRDVEGTQVLLADTFYRIGANCSLTITDGALLQEAIETVLALIGNELPGAPGQGQGPPPTPTGFTNSESNPNQNNPGLASPTEAGAVTP
jgi:hypothetical protein